MELSPTPRAPWHRCQLQEQSSPVWFPFPTRNTSVPWKVCRSLLQLLALPMQCGQAAFPWHLHKFSSNSSPWLLKTKTKTTVINYSLQGPGGNLKVNSQGQGSRRNRSLLTRGRASLSWWLHLQDNCPSCIFSMLGQPTGARGAGWQHTQGLTLHAMTELNPNKVYGIESEGKRNNSCSRG